MWSEWWNRFLASDPSLRRLRTATRVTLSVALTLAIMLPLLAWWGQPLPLALIGAVVAINASLGVNDPDRRQQQVTNLLMPLPTAFALLLAILTAPWPLVHALLFLVVIFVSTYVRRFGPRFFPLGMVAFMGYFFAMFLNPQLPQLPALIMAAVAGALAAFSMRFLALRDDPEGVLERGRRTLRAQVHGLLHAVRDVGEHPDSAQRRRELHNRSVRLNETSLMLENTVGQLDTLDEAGRELLRQRILDVELAAENLLTPLMRLIDHPSGGDAAPHAIGALLAVLRTEPREIREATRLVAERIERQGSVAVAMAVRRLGAGLAELADATGQLGERQAEVPQEPAGEREPEADAETGLRRPELRVAVQVTCATALAIILGQVVSPNRWYWAVITAFVVFISTNSRGELLMRAWQRTAGTLLGVVAGILVAAQITGNAPAEIAMILVCVFLGFYFAGYSYAMMTFFITILLGALYGMLGTFDASVLETRLWETAIGSAAGVLAAVFVLPTRTRSVVRTNIQDFLLSLRDFLRGTGTEIGERGEVTGLQESIRELDDGLQQVINSAKPLTSYRLRSRRSQLQRSVAMLSGCAYYVRNLAVALSATVDMVDDDTRNRLAELLWALADAVESLTDEAQVSFEAAITLAHRTADALHDIAESLPDGPTSLHRSIRWLDRTAQVVEDLARELGAAAPEKQPTA
ncbi:FUSC family protein [Saccharopolyspora phatthalungensis]|uniref:Putative membrane protein YccC n=1 Tax=Saccharopolyspora phatthalungensis TaxID=664693 RepID=A0A840QDM4_9PSEU|nr:FUSC family protein [Saccharopolyspora phatthalungensis]MBB5157910.1 putative membrane protein YccC [Saccharopolyspora phatthalungensis]